MKAYPSEPPLRRQVFWWIALWLIVLLLALAPTAPASPPRAQAVLRIGMTVEDMDRSIDFYTRVLDFQKISDVEVAGEEYERLYGVFGVRCRIVRLKLGDEEIELTEFLAASTRGREIPRDSRSHDRWFQHIAIVTSDINAAYARLRAHKVRHASTGPQLLPESIPNAAGIRAFYFHDPDGHVLELIQFPPDKGEPRWRDKPGLLLGIDHTAIVVEDTDKSLAFYRDMLGLHIVGGSENDGVEQAHLNNVPGAHLRITTLAAESGPKIELLEYLHPRDGRPFPADAKPNDLFHWQTTIANDDVAQSRLLRDPDGHALLFVPTSR